jgi:hypothetical protein
MNTIFNTAAIPDEVRNLVGKGITNNDTLD